MARNHGTDEKGIDFRSNICYLEDISEFVFDRNEANSDQSEFQASLVTLKMKLTTI